MALNHYYIYDNFFAMKSVTKKFSQQNSSHHQKKSELRQRAMLYGIKCILSFVLSSWAVVCPAQSESLLFLIAVRF